MSSADFMPLRQRLTASEYGLIGMFSHHMVGGVASDLSLGVSVEV